MKTKVLNYRVIVEPETYANGKRVFNAYCPTLQVADYGDSVEEVLLSIKDGLVLAIESLKKEGSLVPEDNIEEQMVTSVKVDFV